MVLMLLHSSGPSLLVSCSRLGLTALSTVRSRPLEVTWVTASVPHPAPLCVPHAQVLRSPLAPLPLHQALWITNGHRLMVYRVLSYACFAFVIKQIFVHVIILKLTYIHGHIIEIMHISYQSWYEGYIHTIHITYKYIHSYTSHIHYIYTFNYM